MKMSFNFVLSLILAMVATVAFAQASDVVAPASELVSAGKLGWMSSVMAILLQLAKSDLFGGLFGKIDKAYQPAVVLLLGQLAGLVESIVSGQPFPKAAIEWLLASGNAMALYAVIVKPFTKKKS